MNNERNEIEIDLREIYYVLKEKILAILIVAVLIGGCAAAYSVFMVTPTYKATAKIYILQSSTSLTDFADLQISTVLTKDYAELVKSRPVVQKVNSNLDLEMSYESLCGHVTVENPEDTRIINISITHSDPEKAKVIANEFARVAKRQISEIMQTDEPTVAEVAVTPKSPISPNKTKNTLVGIILGAFLASLVIIIRHIMNDSIVDQDDVEKYLGLTVLATIPVDRSAVQKEAKGIRKQPDSDRKNEYKINIGK